MKIACKTNRSTGETSEDTGNPIFVSVLKLEEAIVHEVDEDIFVAQGPCDVPSSFPFPRVFDETSSPEHLAV